MKMLDRIPPAPLYGKVEKDNTNKKDPNSPDIEKNGIRKYLEYHIPGIDEELLEAYEYLQWNTPDKLFPPYSQNDDIPLDKYSAIHTEIHKEIVKEVLDSSWDVLALKSGMYGGKTSLAFRLLDELEKKGYSTDIFISDVMGEGFVTARSYPDGEQVREAKRYGDMFRNIRLPLKEYYTRLKNGKLRKVHTEKRVVLLDEFSFLDEKSLKKFIKKCRRNNVKVILAGLDRNYLGETLPPFAKLEELVGKSKCKQVECKSFVPGLDEGDEPTGRCTTRYVNVGGKWILDLGVLPLVTSKEKKDIVWYIAARENMTAINLFRHRPHILEYFLHPIEDVAKRQDERLQRFEKELEKKRS